MAEAHDTIQIDFSGGLEHQVEHSCAYSFTIFVYQRIMRLLKTRKNTDTKIKEDLCVDSTNRNHSERGLCYNY